jgi:hypothetical protein
MLFTFFLGEMLTTCFVDGDESLVWFIQVNILKLSASFTAHLSSVNVHEAIYIQIHS